MAIESRAVLKTFFETGDVPTEGQFSDLIDSFISRIDDGVYIYDVSPDEKRFGVGVQEPAYPLGVQSAGTFDGLISLHDSAGALEWLMNMLPDTAPDRGLNFEQQTADGGTTRLFLNGANGKVGMGTLEPDEKLQLEASTPSGLTAVKLLNTATVQNQGWAVGHLQDALTERDGGFAINECGPDEERMIIAPGGNVGINEPLPDTQFHVSRPVTDPNAIISLVEGTGIALVGPITENLAFDFQSIQARQGQMVGGVMNLEPTAMNLQPLGGTLTIHSDNAIAAIDKVFIGEDASVGIGTLSPNEKLEVNGAVKLGSTTESNEGTIRWTGADFEGMTTSGWLSLTAGGGKWSDGPADSILYNAGTAPQVGIGTDAPSASLTVNDTQAVTQGSNIALDVFQRATTTGVGVNDHRIGALVENIGLWGGPADTRDVGLYVAEVSGQQASNSNLAAVLNSNVVIGDLASRSTVIGDNGNRVLAIQNGTAPTVAPNVPSIQLYAQDIAGSSTFHVMNGNGDVVSLYEAVALTAADTNPVPQQYSDEAVILIQNLRDRINGLEATLQAFGLLA